MNAIITSNNEYSFVRQLRTGRPQDIDSNAEDFLLVSTDPDALGFPAILGAPGPENLSSPLQRIAVIKASLIDPQCSGFGTPTSACRFVRSATPVTNGPQGTLAIRRSFTNTTGQPVTRLRFRVIDITTLGNQGASDADLRALTNPVDNVVVTRQDSTTETLRALTLEQPPAQPNGGGLNSSLSANSITLGTPLPPGGRISVQFLLGIVQNGGFRFFVNLEADFNNNTAPALKLSPDALRPDSKTFKSHVAPAAARPPG